MSREINGRSRQAGGAYTIVAEWVCAVAALIVLVLLVLDVRK